MLLVHDRARFHNNKNDPSNSALCANFAWDRSIEIFAERLKQPS
jgi:hypothetical protein